MLMSSQPGGDGGNGDDRKKIPSSCEKDGKLDVPKPLKDVTDRIRHYLSEGTWENVLDDLVRCMKMVSFKNGMAVMDCSRDKAEKGGTQDDGSQPDNGKKKVDKKHHDRLVQIAQFIKTIAQAVGEKFPQKEVDKCKLLTDILLSDILDNAKGALRKTLSLMLTIRQANFACITSPLGKYGMYVSNGLKASPKDNIVLSLDSSKKKAEMKATVQYFYGYKTPSFTLTLTIQLSLNTKTGVFETKNYSDFNISLTDIVHLFSLRDRKEIKNIKHYMSCLDKNARFPPDSEQGGKRGLWVGAEEVCGLPGLEQQFTPTITHRLHCSYGSGVQAQEARALCYQLGVTSSRSKNWNLLPIGLRNSLVASV